MSNEIVEMASALASVTLAGVLALGGYYIKKFFEREIQKIDDEEEREKVFNAFNVLEQMAELVVANLQQTVGDKVKKEIVGLDREYYTGAIEDTEELEILENKLHNLKNVASEEIKNSLDKETKNILQKSCINFDDYTDKLIEKKVRELKKV